MPERGQVHRPQGGYVVRTADGDFVPDDDPPPDWVPYLREPVPVIVPAALPDLDWASLNAGVTRQVLESVGCLDADYVFEQYAYLTTRRVELPEKSYVLSERDAYETVVAQVGGRPMLGVTVLRLVGEPEATQFGPAYRTTPVVRFRLPLDADHETVWPVPGAIAWLIHHPRDRAPRVDLDWERPAGAQHQSLPLREVRMDGATPGSGDMVYSPVIDREPYLTTTPVAAPRAGVDVLPPAPARRRGLFHR